MKKICFILVLLSTCLLSACSQKIDFNKIKKQAGEIYNSGTPLTTEEITRGLKEALSVGSRNASGTASKVNGYYKNPLLFIPFPPEAQNVADKLRQIGLGNKVDEFIVALNRGAELAAKESAPVFVNAITSMSINDAVGILKGSDTSATSYLRRTTGAQLQTRFQPIIDKSLSTVNATKYWTDIINTYNKIPLVKKMNPNLSSYTTGMAIKGLFVLVGQEETKIRRDPAARVTEILKKVFAKK